MSKKSMRSKHFVDPKVQGLLLRRATRYWFLSLSLVASLTILGWIFITPGIGPLVSSPAQLTAMLSGFGVAVGVAVLLLPVALFDLIRVSNRFAGPMVRLHRAMREAARGEKVAPVRFRDGDFWQEFADAFNDLNARLERLETGEADRTGDVELTDDAPLPMTSGV